MELLDKISALEEEASQFGFKWQSADQIMNQIHSECDEIKEHLDHDSSKANQTALQEEIGDLLHAVFSLCIFCKLSPRVTLGQSLTKFERRLRAVVNGYLKARKNGAGFKPLIAAGASKIGHDSRASMRAWL